MPPNARFSVDTHVFRELGELLVGRDSTALLELIKNSYDADSTEVTVTAFDLSDPTHGRIVIQDNGSGMDEGQFVNGFLRIASRFKEQGARRSKFFLRRYTGSKGIGRLAAHKLATLLQVDSIAGDPRHRSKAALRAVIDWELIEQQETLADLDDEISLETERLPKGAATGTTVTLSRLRRPWTDKERLRFVTECQSFQVPAALRVPLPPRILSRPLLFEEPTLRDVDSEDPGCEIRLEGEFREGHSYWDTLIDQTNWLLEIDCKQDKGEVQYAVGPTKRTKRDRPETGRRTFSHPHPAPDEGPFFQARVLVRDEQIRQADLLRWSRQASGIRVYLEGFRVLPYGDPGDDWLKIDADVARRGWRTDDLFEGLVEKEEVEGDWQHSLLPNGSYTGAVFLTQEDAPSLRMLVNREGFVTDKAFDTLVDIVRRGIDLSTRTRAAARARAKAVASEGPGPPPGPHTHGTEDSSERDQHPTPRDESEPPRTLTAAAAEAVDAVRDARQLIAAGGDTVEIADKLKIADSVMVEVVTAAERVSEAAALTRVLASLGTQMAGFVHEIRGLLGTAVAVHESVGRLRERDDLPGGVRRELSALHQTLGDLRRQIERQVVYLGDITSPDARRRRSRQKIADRLTAAARLVTPAMERRGIELANDIPDDLRSTPMFPAELTSVLTNLLTNAVKAAGKNGMIRARGGRADDGGVVVVIENTGKEVDLADAERWFRPFESTTAEVDGALGQGMGLGLTITRDILEQYGVTIGFVPPSRKFKTAVEIRFPA